MNFKNVLSLKLFRLAVLILLPFTSCYEGSSGGCDETYSNATSLGTVKNDPNGTVWSLQNNTVRFKNNKGGSFLFTVDKITDDWETQELYLNEKISSPCTTKGYNYVHVQKEYFTIWCNEVPFRISQTRQRYLLNKKYTDSVNINDLNKTPEAILTRIGTANHTFYTPDTSEYASLDQQLNDSTFLGVNKIPFKGVPAYSLYLKYIYFQRGKGMIGFEFNNGELWTKQ